MMLYRSVCGLLALSLLGCNSYSNRVVAKPSDITLEEAMSSVGKGLRSLYSSAHPAGDEGRSFGLLASEVTVTFNVTAKQDTSQNSKLVLDLNAAPPVIAEGLGAKLGTELSHSNAISASRGNTIVIKFLNPVFAPKDTLVYMSTAATQPATGSTSLSRMLEDIKAKLILPSPVARPAGAGGQ